MVLLHRIFWYVKEEGISEMLVTTYQTVRCHPQYKYSPETLRTYTKTKCCR